MSARPRRVVLLALLAVAAPALAGAAPPTLLPTVPPPPDLRPLVPFVLAPIDKPPALPAELPLPGAPVDVPMLGPAALVLPTAPRPLAYLSPPGPLACVGAFLGIPSKALECGRARFSRGELDEAVPALDQAVRRGDNPDLLTEARYWLGETLRRLGRLEQADWLFRQAVQGAPRGGDYGVWAQHASGWTALQLRDPARARDAFAKLLGSPVPASLDGWARHGLGLAQYALGAYPEAVAAWRDLLARGAPQALAREAAFWYGDALGRTGQAAAGAAELARFVQGGAHPLAGPGQLRLGWWSLAAERWVESVAAFRAYLAQPGADRHWAETGLALALLSSDLDGARTTAEDLASRHPAYALPVLLRIARALADAGRPADAQPVLQGLLAGDLAPPVRAWVLALKGDTFRAQGNRDEARTQYELASRTDASGLIGRMATLRLARINVEMREFSQAARDVDGVLKAAVPAELRAAALLLQGEAAYYAGEFAAAASAFRRAATEFPMHPQAALAQYALGWVALRQDRDDEARREFLRFAEVRPSDANAPDALVLVAELILEKGRDPQGALELLERIVAKYPAHPRTDFARLNRAILFVRTGDPARAVADLRDWVARAPFPPLLGRAHLALGVALLAAGRSADAGQAFARAERAGAGAPSVLGLGAVALVQAQWDEAERRLTEARDLGTAAVGATAEYGLAVVAFHRGRRAEFRRPARAALDADPRGPGAPRLLYTLAAIAVEEKDWAEALQTGRRLVDEFPADDAGDDVLERIGSGAAAARTWPVTYEAYALLRQKYPASPFVESSRVAFAEAQLETGRADGARRELDPLAAAGRGDARALLLLARARTAAGDRAGAIRAYEQAAKLDRSGEPTPSILLTHARLLTEEKRWADARPLLRRVLRASDPGVVAEAAQALGVGFQGEGDHLAAAEYFLTAGYVAPESTAGRRALLGAAASFVALKQPDHAVIVYRKLLAQGDDVPADLAEMARRGLKQLGK